MKNFKKFNIKNIFFAIFAAVIICNPNNSYAEINYGNRVYVDVCANKKDCNIYGYNGIIYARDVARSFRAKYGCDFDIEIKIHAGTYYFNSTIIFDDKLDGGCGSGYTYYVGYGKVIFSGAKKFTAKIKNKKNYIDLSGKYFDSNIFYRNKKIKIKEINNYKIKKWINNEKFCDNMECSGVLLNLPYNPALKVESFRYIGASREFIYDMIRIVGVYNYNGMTMLRVNDYDWGIIINQKFPKSREGEAVKIVLNNFDERGWVYLHGKIYVPSNVREIDIGVVGALINIGGDEPVENFVIRGVKFEKNSWLHDYKGYMSRQSMAYGWSDWDVVLPEGAVNISKSKNIFLENCVFEDISGFGVVNMFGSNNLNILNNIFKRIGAGAIYVSADVTRKDGSAGSVINVKRNFIEDVGRFYYSSSAIFSGYARDVSISENFILNSPYSGISVGWGWSNIPTNMEKNTIKDNVIINSMGILSDGGAIYLLSRQDGTFVGGNILVNFGISGNPVFRFASGIYLDAGVSGVVVGCNYFIGFNKYGDKDVKKYFNQFGNINNYFYEKEKNCQF